MRLARVAHGATLLACALLQPALAQPAQADSALPSFEATSLTGRTVTEAELIGQPTILIVTPSQAAADDTRNWVQALRENVEPDVVRVRDVLAIDLPFFIPEQMAMDRARERIPEKYHDQTWLLPEPVLNRALDIPIGSSKAHVIVLDANGVITGRASGHPTRQRIAEIRSGLPRAGKTSGGAR